MGGRPDLARAAAVQLNIQGAPTEGGGEGEEAGLKEECFLNQICRAQPHAADSYPKSTDIMASIRVSVDVSLIV